MDDERPLTATGPLEFGIAADGFVRWALVDLGAIVEEARERLDLSPIAAAALGRAEAAAVLLLRLAVKAPTRLLLEIVGDGPLRSVLAEVDADGQLRGTVGHPRVDLPAGPGGKLAVGAAVGKGLLRVTRESVGDVRYSSQVELVSGEIGLDVAHYLEQSEQTSSAVLVGVLTKPHGVAAAGGMIVEALPGAPDETLSRLEANLTGVSGISHLLEAGGTAAVREVVLAGLAPEIVDRRELRHACRCNRERIHIHLAQLTPEDRAELRAEDDHLEAACVFCGNRYRFVESEWATS
jgi:molecular chaperone Hsp33